jgi:hypothetical protein
MPKPPPILVELEAKREAAGVTHWALSTESGVSIQTALNLLTKGSGAKTLESIAALGEALGYRLTWAPLPGQRKAKPRR